MKFVFAIRGYEDETVLLPIDWSNEDEALEQIFENVVLYRIPVGSGNIGTLFEKGIPSAGYIYSGEFSVVGDECTPIIRKVKRLYYFKQDVE